MISYEKNYNHTRPAKTNQRTKTTIKIEVMRTIILTMTIILLLAGCKKNDCIVRLYADGSSSVSNNIDIYNVDDLYKLYTIEYYDEDCDNSGVNEILSHNGDTIKVLGRFVNDWTGINRWRLYDTSSSTISIGLSCNNTVNFVPNDTLIYIVTGKLSISVADYLSAKSVNASSINLEDLKCTLLSMTFIDAIKFEKTLRNNYYY